jgi:hypothetical protein
MDGQHCGFAAQWFFEAPVPDMTYLDNRRHALSHNTLFAGFFAATAGANLPRCE